jgi:hypothetical protein
MVLQPPPPLATSVWKGKREDRKMELWIRSQSKKDAKNKGGLWKEKRNNLEATHSFAFTHVHLFQHSIAAQGYLERIDRQDNKGLFLDSTFIEYIIGSQWFLLSQGQLKKETEERKSWREKEKKRGHM